MGSNRRLGQFSQQSDQSRHRRLLKLIGLGQIAVAQGLLDLPVEPERRLIEQSPVITRTVILQKLIRILAGRRCRTRSSS